MDEYQLIDTMNSTIAQAWTVSEYGLSIVTGYLLIAHFIGRKLTFFQVSFANFVFLIMHTLVVISNVQISQRLQLIQKRLVETGSDLASHSIITGINEEAISGWPAYMTGAIITLGCLIFMWSVRHPRQTNVDD